MRKIKFRGRWNNQWVYGGIEINSTNGEVFIGSHLVKSLVEPETVGQFTGLLDKNGKPIYEGDIVEQWHYYDNFGKVDEDETHIGAVEFTAKAAFMSKIPNKYGLGIYEKFEQENRITIIGNIYENSELLT